MSYIIIIFFFLFINILNIKSQYCPIRAEKGLTDIFYNSTEETLSFKIPIESDSYNTLKLNLSYPYRSNRTYCTSDCEKITNSETNDKYYYCKIKHSECDLMDGTSKKIKIHSIIDYPNCQFENLYPITSVINFESNNIEMVCSNYKLCFFFQDYNLQNHPFDNISFNFPIYYKDKMETANCIIPKNSKYIPCTIDASERIFEKGYFINFEYNKSIELTQDLNLSLKLNKYVLEDDCGKNINQGKIIEKFHKNYNIYNNNLTYHYLLLKN